MSRKVTFNGYDAKGIYGELGPLGTYRNLESFTTAPGGNMAVRLGQVQGVHSFDHNTMNIKEPMRVGRFIGTWLRTPPMLSDAATVWWNYMLSDSILEFSGLTDNEIAVMNRTEGGNQREYSFAGNYKENNANFTLRIPEYKGSPFRKLAAYVASGISDKESGVGHFHGHPELRYSAVNYGGDFFYALLGPSGRPDDIEFACVYLNAWFGKDYLTHLNSGTIGDSGNDITLDAEFRGIYVQNDEVNALAMYLVEALGYYNDNFNDIVLPHYLSTIINNDQKLAFNGDGTLNLGNGIRNSAFSHDVLKRLNAVRNSANVDDYPLEAEIALKEKTKTPQFGQLDIVQDGISDRGTKSDPTITPQVLA